MVRILAIFLFIFGSVSAEGDTNEESVVWSFSAGPVHSQWDGYLGDSIWGGQFRTSATYQGMGPIQASLGVGYRVDGGEGLFVHRLVTPILLGPRLCFGLFCTSLVSGLEVSFYLFVNRDDLFYVPASSQLKRVELLWPNTLEMSFPLNQQWQLGASMNATMGLTPAATQRSREYKTMILAPELKVSMVF